MDLVAGIPTGSIRVSFGYMSTMKDVNKLISFVKDCFLEVKETLASPVGEYKSIQENSSLVVPVTEGNLLSTGVKVTVVSDVSHYNNVMLKNIFLYPVKSCGCFKVSYYKT